tara:strand:+ start:428 stop:835 length:408 start_codon:yes stop_codon:yes gene_type:complete
MKKKITEELKKIISKYIDYLIPEDASQGMPCATKAINLENFIEEILSLENFDNFYKFIINFKNFENNAEISLSFKNNYEALTLEKNIFKILCKHYFLSENVLLSLSKKNEFLENDYPKLLTKSSMIAKLKENYKE